MNSEIPKIYDVEKLINQIDRNENFILFGSHGSGKTFSGINYALDRIEENKCVFFTSSTKNEIIEKIRFLNPSPIKNFDENFYLYEAPKIILKNGNKIEDSVFVKIFMGILKPIEAIKPQKIIFDEVTPYLTFTDLDLLEKTMKKIISYLKYFDTKGLFTVAEPVSSRAKVVGDMLKYVFGDYTNL
jgi:hypothetical protein